MVDTATIIRYNTRTILQKALVHRNWIFSVQPYEGATPPVTLPNPQFLGDIGEDGMRDLLDRFYEELFQSPIKNLFPTSKKQ